jgi:hypothetical protein
MPVADLYCRWRMSPPQSEPTNDPLESDHVLLGHFADGRGQDGMAELNADRAIHIILEGS